MFAAVWIPAFAGMTGEKAGMAGRRLGRARACGRDARAPRGLAGAGFEGRSG